MPPSPLNINMLRWPIYLRRNFCTFHEAGGALARHLSRNERTSLSHRDRCFERRVFSCCSRCHAPSLSQSSKPPKAAGTIERKEERTFAFKRSQNCSGFHFHMIKRDRIADAYATSCRCVSKWQGNILLHGCSNSLLWWSSAALLSISVVPAGKGK